MADLKIGIDKYQDTITLKNENINIVLRLGEFIDTIDRIGINGSKACDWIFDIDIEVTTKTKL